MCEVFEPALQKPGYTYTGAFFHVEEITQPQGHSTPAAMKDIKQRERPGMEREWDCIKQMREWILQNNLASGR